MAIVSCPECKEEVSDKAPTCPHCGFVLIRKPLLRPWLVTVTVLTLLAAGGAALGMRKPEYAQVDQLRAEQDVEGTHDEHTRQRFYRLYQEHPHDAMYIYLWARWCCVDDARSSSTSRRRASRPTRVSAWNYNMASRARAARPESRRRTTRSMKGAALDPGNLELAKKKQSLKVIIDRKLMDQAKPAPGPGATYRGLFRSSIRSPEGADAEAIEKNHLAAVRGLSVCENPYSDSCIRAYLPRRGWRHEHREAHRAPGREKVTGTVVTNGRAENIMLADAVTVEPP